ncbi:MerR family transcriptional regulator [Glutamicibacter ardleyensis]|uniref:MerR family transcriptional regulator n=2 Tax=Glutamicibacter ardleyensis TaxID=225894 RepID=A0ABQ2DTB4_9MICC|nr:MerR family transcriptional regulator [Glutamicibacter ardleyensis]GGJ72016.1 MerR family transcriptional regulator [Glutamicibacter ardleyensis]
MENNERDVKTMHIGELAETTGLSLRTIRHYDEVGLLPASGRTEGGFRVYTVADMHRLQVVKQMKPLGFSLDEMAEILALLADRDSGELTEGARERLAFLTGEAKSRREKIIRNLRQADELIDRLDSSGEAPAGQ